MTTSDRAILAFKSVIRIVISPHGMDIGNKELPNVETLECMHGLVALENIHSV